MMVQSVKQNKKTTVAHIMLNCIFSHIFDLEVRLIESNTPGHRVPQIDNLFPSVSKK